MTAHENKLMAVRRYDILTLSAPSVNTGTFADGIDQDQTAQNTQSDLWSIPSACLVKLLTHFFWTTNFRLFQIERLCRRQFKI